MNSIEDFVRTLFEIKFDNVFELTELRRKLLDTQIVQFESHNILHKASNIPTCNCRDYHHRNEIIIAIGEKIDNLIERLQNDNH